MDISIAKANERVIQSRLEVKQIEKDLKNATKVLKDVYLEQKEHQDSLSIRGEEMLDLRLGKMSKEYKENVNARRVRGSTPSNPTAQSSPEDINENEWNNFSAFNPKEFVVRLSEEPKHIRPSYAGDIDKIQFNRRVENNQRNENFAATRRGW